MLFVLSGLPSDKCLRPSLGPPRPLNTTSMRSAAHVSKGSFNRMILIKRIEVAEVI